MDSIAVSKVKVEDPVEALKQMIEIFKTNNGKELVRERLSEITSDMKESTLLNMEKGWTKRLEKQGPMLVKHLTPGLSGKPTLVANESPRGKEWNKVAIFKVKDGKEFKIYLMKNGLWGLHI